MMHSPFGAEAWGKLYTTFLVSRRAARCGGRSSNSNIMWHEGGEELSSFNNNIPTPIQCLSLPPSVRCAVSLFWFSRDNSNVFRFVSLQVTVVGANCVALIDDGTFRTFGQGLDKGITVIVGGTVAI